MCIYLRDAPNQMYEYFLLQKNFKNAFKTWQKYIKKTYNYFFLYKFIKVNIINDGFKTRYLRV